MTPYFSSLKTSRRITAIRSANAAERATQLSEFARELRICVLHMIQHAGLGHIGGDFSVVDILATLFGGVMDYDPENPTWPERDRFILSKGHCSASLYATLAFSGFFSPAQLATFAQPLSILNGLEREALDLQDVRRQLRLAARWRIEPDAARVGFALAQWLNHRMEGLCRRLDETAIKRACGVLDLFMDEHQWRLSLYQAQNLYYEILKTHRDSFFLSPELKEALYGLGRRLKFSDSLLKL